MLIPKSIPKKIAYVLYPVLCSLHGILFGILYAPAQAIMFGMDLNKTLAWIMTGVPVDIIHGIGNFAVGLLIVPVSDALAKLVKTK